MVGRIVYHDPDLSGRDRRERKLAPHLVVARYTSAGNCHPTTTIPVLHVEGSQSVEREGHRLSRRRPVPGNYPAR